MLAGILKVYSLLNHTPEMTRLGAALCKQAQVTKYIGFCVAPFTSAGGGLDAKQLNLVRSTHYYVPLLIEGKSYIVCDV